MSHGVADATSFAMFMRDWSAIHAGRLEGGENPPAFCLPAALENVASGFEAETFARVAGLEPVAPPPCILESLLAVLRLVGHVTTPPRTAVRFTRAELHEMKSAASPPGGWVSTNEALLAHVTAALLIASELERAEGANVIVNLRGKLPGLDRFFGNAVICVPVLAESRGSSPWSAAAIHEALREKLEDPE